MRITRLFCVSVAVLALAHPIFAAENLWFGTWKFNPAKSHLTGQTDTVTKIPNGYHFDLGAVKYDIFEDGQDHRIIGNYTANLKSVGKNEWLVVNKVDGKETRRATLRLSPESGKLAEDIAGTRADGSSYTEHVVLKRQGTGEGLAGTWKEVKVAAPDSKVKVYSEAEGGKLKIETPAAQEVIVASLDGVPVFATGPRTVSGETYAFTKVSTTETKYTVFESGKPYIEGTQTITSDGRVLKDVSWLVIAPSEKTTEIWEKQ